MDPLQWIQAFKAAGDTKTFLALVVIFTFVLTILGVRFFSKFVTKKSYREEQKSLSDTIQSNTITMTKVAKDAATQCREDAKNAALSLKEYHNVVIDLGKAVSGLSGEVRAYARAIRQGHPKKRKT